MKNLPANPLGLVGFRNLLAAFVFASVGPALLRAEPPAAVSITENNRTQTITTDSGEVTILGNNNKITIKGDCKTLTVEGNKNEVTAGAVGTIAIPGNKNRVTWTSGVGADQPQVSNLGSGNEVSAAPAQ